jgi:sensor domain CHASE-containing protein
MTVLGENPGEQYFDTPAVTENATISTHVAYIKGIGITSDNAAATSALSGTSSVTIGAFHTTAEIIVSGW